MIGWHPFEVGVDLWKILDPPLVCNCLKTKLKVYLCLGVLLATFYSFLFLLFVSVWYDIFSHDTLNHRRIYIVKFWTHASQVQFSSFSRSFRQNLAKLHVGAPPTLRVGAPSRKSWIRRREDVHPSIVII